jgi:hypothetical protein
MKAIRIMLAVMLVATAQAGDRRCHRRKPEPNWIILRQETYQVQGVPTSRLIIGKREIDIYRNGMAFEKDRRVR